MKCPNCNTKIPWWRRRQFIVCKKCDTSLIMANYLTAVYIAVVFPLFVLVVAILISPYLFIIGVLIELFLYDWFMTKFQYYKVNDCENDS